MAGSLLVEFAILVASFQSLAPKMAVFAWRILLLLLTVLRRLIFRTQVEVVVEVAQATFLATRSWAAQD